MVRNPSFNYGWLMPTVGGSIGIWGGLLNTVVGEDGAGGGVKGIDQVVGEIAARVTTLENDFTALEDRVTVLEDSGLTAMYGRRARDTGDGDQSIPVRTFTLLTFAQTSFDSGNVTVVDSSRLTVPTDGAGLWQIRAVLQLKARSDSDDSLNYRVEIRKTLASDGSTVVVAEAEIPHLNDGFSSESGDITLIAEANEVTADGDFFEVWLRASDPDTSVAGAVRDGDGSYFEAARLAPLAGS